MARFAAIAGKIIRSSNITKSYTKSMVASSNGISHEVATLF